jgi:hypothetical protein
VAGKQGTICASVGVAGGAGVTGLRIRGYPGGAGGCLGAGCPGGPSLVAFHYY